jgi:hypothetical protein
MPNNGSIALWCVPQANSAPIEIEAHFNYWRLSGDKTFARRRAIQAPVRDFVEIGVLIDDIKQIDSICFYLPTTVMREQIVDCAPYLAQAEFAQGIFNEVITVTAPAPGGPQCVVLHDQANAIFTRVHCFAPGPSGLDARELMLAVQNGGTVLTITPAAILGACGHTTPPAKTYFRLRVYLDDGEPRNPFVKVIRPVDEKFQSGYDEIEYIDFRMNEARTLPPAIEQRMRADRLKGGDVVFRLVAFLTAVPVHSELSVSNTPSHKMRLLENVWNGYAPSEIPDGMVVYHWKKLPETQKPITDFSAFVKLQTRRTSRKILWTYVLIAFGIGLLGNWTAEAVSDSVGSLWAEPAIEEPQRALPVPERPVPALPAPSEANPRGADSASPTIPQSRQLGPPAKAQSSRTPPDTVGNRL